MYQQPEHDHHHPHAHPHPHGGLGERIGAIVQWHHHDVAADEVLASSAEGMRALQLSLVGLLITAGIQLAIALASGSVGLLADTIHNFSDALTAVPLWLAFRIGQWPANRRFTYGYGRAEDVAGLVIVLVIVASAVAAFWEAYRRLIHPAPIHQLGWVMVAALAGFLGNELVAILRIRTGRRIGSAALEADGQHARTDGLTSLGVLLGTIAVALGAPIADPLVGLAISGMILLVSKDALVAMGHRLLDAVDPALVERAEEVARSTPGVLDVHELRLRWVGHQLTAELHVSVDEAASLAQAHAIAEEVRHRLFHALPRLTEVSVHVDPTGDSGIDYHASTAHHRPRRAGDGG